MRSVPMAAMILLLAAIIASNDETTPTPNPNLTISNMPATGPVSGVEAKPLTGRAKRHALLAQRRMNPPPATRNPEESNPCAGGPNLRFLSVTVNDPASNGNADGWIQPGETVDLQIALVNLGNEAARSVYGQLSPGEDNPYVTITTVGALWPDIPAHGTGTTLSPHFQIQVSNTLPCGYPVELLLDLRAVGFSALVPVRLDLDRRFYLDTVSDPARRYNESDTVIYGALAGDATGISSAMGDVNGDGYKDLILGAGRAAPPGGGRSQAGEVWLIYGSSAGLPAIVDLAGPPAGAVVIYGVHATDWLGQAVQSGDINGDGYDDIIMGAPLADGSAGSKNQSGETWIVYGQAASIFSPIDLAMNPANTAVIYGADAGDSSGMHLGVADINGDGYDDALIAAYNGSGPSNTKPGAGEVWVIYGSADKLPAPPSGTELASPPASARPIYGPEAGDNLGSSVASGDLDGDGYDDLILGASMSDGAGNGRAYAGEAWVLYGQAEILPASTDLAAPPTNAMVIFGADPGDGFSTLTAGDVNGDGYEDAACGSPFANGPDNTKATSGEAWILYGGAARWPASIDLFSPPSNARVIFGPDASDQLGFPEDGASGDINGDGFDDLVLGVSAGDGANSAKSNAGEAWVIFGRESYLPAATNLASPPAFARAVYGADAGDALSLSVAAGDVNMDGMDDMILGGTGGDGPANSRSAAGEVHLVLGQATRTYWEKSESYSWIDASTGTNLNLGCNDCSASVPIGFTFPYYGEKFTALTISANGFASFAAVDDSISAVPRCINSKNPSSLSSLGPIIAPFWDNLDLRSGGAVYTQISGTAPNRRFTIEWLNVPHYAGTTNGVTFEISLFESTGQILFAYQDVSFGNLIWDSGAAAVVGVQNRTGAEGVAHGCSYASLSASQAFSMNPTTPVFQDNLESIDPSASKVGKWTVGGGSLWHLTSGATTCSAPNYHGRQTAWYEGDDMSCSYNNNIAEDTLDLPRIGEFPDDGRFTFWERFLSESGSDTGYLAIQIDGGGYGGQWGQSGGTSTWALHPTFLNGHAGHAVDLRFQFTSNASVTSLGWMVDDVKLIGCNAKGISGLVNAFAFAQPSLYCGNGSTTGYLDAVGSSCADGSQPINWQWMEDGFSIPGANQSTYAIPSGHATGTFFFSCGVTCSGGSSTSAPQPVQIVAVPLAVGDTLKLAKAGGGVSVVYTWTDTGGSATEYRIVQDPAANGAFGALTGSAPSGDPGLTKAMPSGNILFFLVAGANNTCGMGPIR